MSGPLQLIAVSFPSSGLPERVLAEVDRVEARGGIRVLDMLLVTKDPGGNVVQVSFGEDEDFGELVSRLLPISGAPGLDGGGAADELWAQAESLPADSSSLFLLVEYRWAQGIFDAIDEEGGAVLGAGFLSPELARVINDEVAALEDAAWSIAAAQAAEADARLTIDAALAETDQVVAASALIRAEAAADALRALTNAGLVESEAAHEAADALSAAGLIIAAADDAVARALDADASLVATADAATAEVIAEDLEAIGAAEDKSANAAMAASVTPAELRVLRYLPTKLTFALIADKLGISRGAAKNRAERAYQKLGVHNRADAVERARALRVLP